jgi:alkyl sulfatase BDS1-like metallo-beta-lactamase superfamily hydrolase
MLRQDSATTSHQALAVCCSHPACKDKLSGADQVSVDGDDEAFATLLGLLEEFDSYFNIVTPVH